MMTYEITVDNVTLGEFEIWEGENLWQAMSEEPELVIVDSEDNDDRLSEWQNIPDDDIFTLLESANDKNFINDYEIDEIEDEEE